LGHDRFVNFSLSTKSTKAHPVDRNANSFSATEAHTDLQRVTISTPEKQPQKQRFFKGFWLWFSAKRSRFSEK
jgi:hypothetical protein